MNWDQNKGNLKQAWGKVKERSGRSTENEIQVIDGQLDQFTGKTQQRFGVAKDDA